MTDFDFTYRVLPAVLGALIGALVTRFLSRRRERIVLTFEMHRELNNYDMALHRRKADNMIKANPIIDYSKLSEINEEASVSAFVLLRFYQRLSQALCYHQLTNRLVPGLFGETFYFWYYISYEKNLLPLKWESSSQIADLAKWFEKKIPKEKHQRLKADFDQRLLERIERSKLVLDDKNE